MTTATSKINKQVVLASRPVGEPTDENFNLIESAIPEPGDNEVLLQTIFLSLDPYMRGRMSDAKSYAQPVPIGGVMEGATVCKVVATKNKNFSVGDHVVSYSGWQTYSISDGVGLRKVDESIAPLHTALGVLGMPGLTAYTGLLTIGKPAEGETVVVSAASGAVGAVVGQIAKIKGCRVIGIAGGKKKCDYVTEELGFDACLDHKANDLAEQLSKVCPKGIDVYFENVSGPVFDAVLPLLNDFARIPVCGLIAHYNATELPPGPDRLPALMRDILVKRLTFRGFIVTDFADQYMDFARDVSGWIKSGKIKFKVDMVSGLDRAPRALQGLLRGENFGKVIVEV
jgi:NADPH-dependent curcumin reductase